MKKISIVRYYWLSDRYFGKALSSISQSPNEDFIQEIKGFFDVIKLQFKFNRQQMLFLRNHDHKAEDIAKHILSISHGIIVNLSGRALDIKYLAGVDLDISNLKYYLQVVYQAKQPTVFAVENIKGSPVPIEIKINPKDIRDGKHLVKFLEESPRHYFNLEDDIWQPTSPTMQAIREILKVPDEIPLLPYSHDKPASIENILKTLLAKIEKQTQ